MSHRPGHPLRRVHGKLPIPPTVLAPGSPLLSLVLPKTPSSRLRTLEVILRPPRDCLSWFSLCSSSSTLLVYFLSGHPISFLSLASFICCNLYPPTRVPAYASGRLPALGSLWASAGLRSTANTHTHDLRWTRSVPLFIPSPPRGNRPSRTSALPCALWSIHVSRADARSECLVRPGPSYQRYYHHDYRCRLHHHYALQHPGL